MNNADAQFESDCQNCVGLCCVSLSFSRAEGQFGHDKMAGIACQYLDAGHGCRIHAHREQLGYEGCIDFECLGAGQRATAYLRRSERQGPDTTRIVHTRFALLLRLQEMRMALRDATSLDLSDLQQVTRLGLLARIAMLADNEEDDIAGASESVLAEAHTLLRQLVDTAEV